MEYQYKVIILGDAKSGKSSLLQMSHDQIFNEAQETTIGINIRVNQVKLRGLQTRKIHYYDVGLGEDFIQKVQSFKKRMYQAIIVYDVTNPDGLASVQRWLNFIGESLSELQIIIVANKVDKINERIITTMKGIKFAKQHGLQYYETSAQDNQSVEFMFESALYKLIIHRQNQLQNSEEKRQNDLLWHRTRNYQKFIKIIMVFLVVLLFLVIFTLNFTNLINIINSFDVQKNYIISTVGGTFTLICLIFILYSGFTLKRQ